MICRDYFTKSGHVRQFVNAFLLDHGGIHVGNQHLLAPRCGLLHSKIDGAALQQCGEFTPGCLQVRASRQHQVAGDAGSEPDDFNRAGSAGGGCHKGRIEHGIFRIGDQRGQQIHVLVHGAQAGGDWPWLTFRRRS